MRTICPRRGFLQFDRVGSFPVQVNVDGILYDSVIEVVDRVPPQIYGAKKTTVYIGQPVSYKKGVYAEDDEDGEVSISVDSSQVNLKVEGEYPLYYTAVDSSGNETTVEVTVTVKQQSVPKEDLEKLADEVLAEITTEDMTILEKSWAIYKYINTHLTYVGSSDKTDWMKEAHRGITRAVGDCFTYYSMSELLLNRIGIQTLSVERASMGEETNHYWHMVNYGQGWYHFDACIHIPKLVSFMLTTEELDAFSRRAGPNNYYYRYDRENYPVSEAKPTEEIRLSEPKTDGFNIYENKKHDCSLGKGGEITKELGVIGGMGPLATAYFMELVAKMTDARADNEHIPMIVCCRPDT